MPKRVLVNYPTDLPSMGRADTLSTIAISIINKKLDKGESLEEISRYKWTTALGRERKMTRQEIKTIKQTGKLTIK